MSASAETSDWDIRPERAEDEARIEALTEAGFGPGRFAKSAYRLREGVAPVADLGFVAVENGVLRGSVRFWPIRVGGDDDLLLGPLAVESDQRGRGIGISLMQAGIAAARARRLARHPAGGRRALLCPGGLFEACRRDGCGFPGRWIQPASGPGAEAGRRWKNCPATFAARGSTIRSARMARR